MPRCEPVAEAFYNEPETWSLEHYDNVKDLVGVVPPTWFRPVGIPC